MLNNLGIKLLCVLVAAVLWVQVAGGLQVEEMVQLPLELVGLADSLTVRTTTVPEQVGVRIRGSKLQLLRDDVLRKNPGRVEVDMSNSSPGYYRYEVSVLDVRAPVEALDIVPPLTLNIPVHRLATRDVPVRLAVEGQLPQGFTMAGRPEIIPAEVRVRGPEASVNQLSHVNTLPVRFERRRDSFRETVGLVQPDIDTHVHPLEVQVEVVVDEIVERPFVNVPIRVLSEMDPARYHVEPTTAQVRVVGASGAVRGLALEDVSVLLKIGEREPGLYELEPEVVVPEGIASTSVEPPTFQLIVEVEGEQSP